MKSQTKFLIFSALILSAIYAYRFTDWFKEKKIQIKYRIVPERGARKLDTVDPVTFYLDQEYLLSSLKVVSMDDAATNKYPHALWHLVSDSNSVPVTDFVYGIAPGRMKPKIAGLLPEPLRRGENYRISIEAKKIKGEKDFQIH